MAPARPRPPAGGNRMSVRLRVTEWVDETRWRWVLEDSAGAFLADHPVQLDPTSREYRGWCDLRPYIDFYTPTVPPAAQLRTLGQWVGTAVFGGLRPALQEVGGGAAQAVAVEIPPEADALLARPFELACLADGTRFDGAGLRFVYARA